MAILPVNHKTAWKPVTRETEATAKEPCKSGYYYRALSGSRFVRKSDGLQKHKRTQLRAPDYTEAHDDSIRPPASYGISVQLFYAHWRPLHARLRCSTRVQACTSVAWKIYAQIRGWCCLPPRGISPSLPRMALENREPVSLNNAKGSIYGRSYRDSMLLPTCPLVDTLFLFYTSD